MTDRERRFEIAEYERDRALTSTQLHSSKLCGSAAHIEKYTAQLARIDARLAELRSPVLLRSR